MTTSPPEQPQPTAPFAPSTAPPAGWYADPHGAPVQRWWDGARWTEHEHVQAPVTAYCRSCAAALDPRAVVCPRCGVPQSGAAPAAAYAAVQPSPRVPGLAILFSFLFPGAGHLYAGRSDAVTITMLAISGVNLLLSFTLIWLVVGIPVFIGTAIFTMIDSPKWVRQWNVAHGFPPG